jgi:hypothetical protein
MLTKLISAKLSTSGLASPSITYPELIAVLLTGLAVSLGILGVIIAGLALWGYRAIRDESKEISAKIARSETRKRVSEYLRSPAGAEIVENEVARRFDELKEGLAIGNSYSKLASDSSILESGLEDHKSKVGKPYQKKGGPA